MIRYDDEFIPYHEGLPFQQGSGMSPMAGLLHVLAPNSLLSSVKNLAQNSIVKEIGKEVGAQLVGQAIQKVVGCAETPRAENDVRPVLKKRRRKNEAWTTSPILSKKQMRHESEEDSMDSS